MSEWVKLSDKIPKRHERVLLYWSRTGHVEDGEILRTEDGNLHHILFDGEMVNENPTHWMPLPEPPL